MRRIILGCLAFGTLLLNGDLPASVGKPASTPQETVIRILLVADNRLSGADITAAKNFLMNAWLSTDFGGMNLPTDVAFANNGNHLSVGTTVFSGDDDEQADKLRVWVEDIAPPAAVGRRDFHGADVVIGLSSKFDNASCGHAVQENWKGFNPGFVQDANGLDLRGANRDYVAVAQIVGHTSCRYYLGAHEFGHLLGGGHRDQIYGFNGGLLPNSKAHRLTVNPGGVQKQVITAIGHGPQTVDCPSSDPAHCNHVGRFSGFATANNNAEAFNVTARSVANYRGPAMPVQPATCSDGISNDGDSLVDSADPDCAVCNQEVCPSNPNPPSCNATTPPIGMIGWITQICYPDPTGGTLYQIVWAHACPGQVSFYEVWAAQPTSNPYTYRWTVVPPTTSAVVYGSSARIKVKSCGTGGCSALSSSNFLAVDLC
ncbi:MAG: hypothetical protein OEW68_03860 [Gammaproteobacteria bacterium]|nr:hypothetical protein [Gammaproteobacteria bacterium]MDH4313956.1 hypothetical protein [Gammaproteobacteria bacterium]MDH5212689.1 hypothetical protein [Gammaproteobacteria bacterium]MDH5499640.1 hypothetical protein [Gammaproteobacteria bacterium]